MEASVFQFVLRLFDVRRDMRCPSVPDVKNASFKWRSWIANVDGDLYITLENEWSVKPAFAFKSGVYLRCNYR